MLQGPGDFQCCKMAILPLLPNKIISHFFTGSLGAATSKLSLPTVMGMNDVTPYFYVIGTRMCRLHRQTVNDELFKYTNDHPSFIETHFKMRVLHTMTNLINLACDE